MFLRGGYSSLANFCRQLFLKKALNNHNVVKCENVFGLCAKIIDMPVSVGLSARNLLCRITKILLQAEACLSCGKGAGLPVSHHTLGDIPAQVSSCLSHRPVVDVH